MTQPASRSTAHRRPDAQFRNGDRAPPGARYLGFTPSLRRLDYARSVRLPWMGRTVQRGRGRCFRRGDPSCRAALCAGEPVMHGLRSRDPVPVVRRPAGLCRRPQPFRAARSAEPPGRSRHSHPAQRPPAGPVKRPSGQPLAAPSSAKRPQRRDGPRRCRTHASSPSPKRRTTMTEKADVYTRVTNKILADLERGNLTWLQPWQAGHQAGPVSRPLRAGGKAYRGINVLMLWAAAMEKGYSCPLWLTYKQAAELGGQVRKGEKGSLVVYADKFTKEGTDDKGAALEIEIPFMKGYTVFNAQQIDGLPGHFYATVPPLNTDIERLESVERFFAGTK